MASAAETLVCSGRCTPRTLKSSGVGASATVGTGRGPLELDHIACERVQREREHDLARRQLDRRRQAGQCDERASAVGLHQRAHLNVERTAHDRGWRQWRSWCACRRCGRCGALAASARPWAQAWVPQSATWARWWAPQLAPAVGVCVGATVGGVGALVGAGDTVGAGDGATEGGVGALVGAVVGAAVAVLMGLMASAQ